MNPGLMDQRVTLQGKQSPMDREANGEEAIDWTDIATVWARAEVIRGREFINLRAAASEITTRFTIRYRSDLSTAVRVLWDAVPYQIVQVTPIPSGRPAMLELWGYADATP